MKGVTILTDQKESLKFLIGKMMQEDPIFFSRIGGSDTNAIKHYYDIVDFFANENLCQFYSNIVKSYNGYFDFAEDRLTQKTNFKKYLDDMIMFYRNSDTYSWTQLEGYIKHDQVKFLEDVLAGKILINYGVICHIRTFLETLSTWGAGKKILIVSCFSKSIQHQWERRDKLHIDYTFPECELLTYNTPITYNVKEDTKEGLGLTTNNWHEECKRRAEEIGKLDFDIALLSCASSGMYLGTYIRDVMHKKALYLGGVVNMMFNIYGGRFSTYAHLHGLNMEYEIDPLENADIENIKGGRGIEGECVHAYFGKREKI